MDETVLCTQSRLQASFPPRHPRDKVDRSSVLQDWPKVNPASIPLSVAPIYSYSGSPSERVTGRFGGANFSNLCDGSGPIKIMGTLLIAVLFLLLGTAVPSYSQQDQRDEAKPPQQEEPKPAHSDHAASPERKGAHPSVQEQQRPQEERRAEPGQQQRQQQED